MGQMWGTALEHWTEGSTSHDHDSLVYSLQLRNLIKLKYLNLYATPVLSYTFFVGLFTEVWILIKFAG